MKRQSDGWQHVGLATAAVAVGLAFFAYFLRANAAFVHDDAFIALRYARNWLAGEGLVWNAGEPVEGYTSFLMIVLTSAVARLFQADLVSAARAVNLASVAGLVVYLGLELRRRAAPDERNALSIAVPLLLVLGSSSLAVWVLGALEAPLFALVVTLALGESMRLLESPTETRRALIAGLALALPALTRPDGLFFVGVCGAFLLVRGARTGRAALVPTGVLGAACWLPIGAHVAWRLAYYGELLPNTVHAKAFGLPPGLATGGWSYVAGFLLSPPFVPTAALALGFAALAGWRGLRDRVSTLNVALLLACILGYAGMIGRVGGDFMPEHRLLLPLVPLSALVIGMTLAPLSRQSRGWPVPALLVAVCVALGLQALRAPQSVDPAAFLGTIIGRHVADEWPADTLVASNSAGSLPYFAGRYRYVDMLGLNDAHIARRSIDAMRSRWQLLPGHAKGDGRYVLARAPDILILGPAEGTRAGEPWFLSDIEIAESPELHRLYRERSEAIDVRGVSGFQHYPSTRTGTLSFVYYERVLRAR